MKKRLLFIFTLFISSLGFSQEFRGQWKGEFVDRSTSFETFGGEKCDYVLELETQGDRVHGYSYTYFTDNGKKFYTICKVIGTVNRKNKYIEVRETVRTKTNVPSNIRNCFQTHQLTYYKQGNTEVLEGKWIPAPDQDGDCGFGVTNLTRRVLVAYKPPASSRASQVTARKPAPKPAVSPQTKQPVAGKKPVTKKTPPLVSKERETGTVKRNEVADVPLSKRIIPVPGGSISTPPEYKRRSKGVLQTIEVESESIKVDLYDNGEIDGDSVSLFYNGKLLASNKRLSDKAISFTLPVDKDIDENELVMYAENLGSIPPNTALMIVTDGVRRFEVRITSDLQKSGVIRFVHLDKKVNKK